MKRSYRLYLGKWLVKLFCLLTCLTFSSCASIPRTSVMQTGDYEAVSNEISARLQNSAFLADRSPDSPRIVIALQKVENLTDDLLDESAKWYCVERIKNYHDLGSWRREKNIHFTLAAERLEDARERNNLQKGFMNRAPTHVLKPTFYSVRRSSTSGRTDLYYCSYVIFNLATSEEVWSDKFEFKRVAFGRSWD